MPSHVTHRFYADNHSDQWRLKGTLRSWQTFIYTLFFHWSPFKLIFHSARIVRSWALAHLVQPISHHWFGCNIFANRFHTSKITLFLSLPMPYRYSYVTIKSIANHNLFVDPLTSRYSITSTFQLSIRLSKSLNYRQDVNNYINYKKYSTI